MRGSWIGAGVGVVDYYILILWLDKRCNCLALIGQELLNCISGTIRVWVCNNRSFLSRCPLCTLAMVDNSFDDRPPCSSIDICSHFCPSHRTRRPIRTSYQTSNKALIGWYATLCTTRRHLISLQQQLRVGKIINCPLFDTLCVLILNGAKMRSKFFREVHLNTKIIQMKQIVKWNMVEYSRYGTFKTQNCAIFTVLKLIFHPLHQPWITTSHGRILNSV